MLVITCIFNSFSPSNSLIIVLTVLGFISLVLISAIFHLPSTKKRTTKKICRELSSLLENTTLTTSDVDPLQTFEDFKVTHEEAKKIATNQIPIIMTGEPNNYSTKAEFLKCHPEYRNTGSWKEVQIVFTNSLDSNTGKMKKAREKGIRIELY